MSDSLSHEIALGFIGILIAMMGYLIKWVIDQNKEDKVKLNEKIKDEKESLQVSIQNVAGTIDAHINDCNKIPKSLILEKIENLCDKTDRNYDSNEKMFDSINKNFDKVDFRFIKLEDRIEKVKENV